MAQEGGLHKLEPGRVMLVCGDTTNNEWVKAFLSAPNDHLEDTHVLVCSPTIQAGHSLEKHIVKQFCFFDLHVMSHGDEVQHFERLRRDKRAHEIETPVFYVAKGCGGRLQSNFEKQFLNSERYVGDEILRSIYADIQCEMADSVNRHWWYVACLFAYACAHMRRTRVWIALACACVCERKRVEYVACSCLFAHAHAHMRRMRVCSALARVSASVSNW